MKFGKTQCNPHVDSGSAESVTFGEFTISKFGDGCVWIEDGDVDAGSFEESKFVEHIRKFYDENM